MRRFALLLASALLFTLASALAADDAKDELKKLDGVWTATEGEANGQALPAEDVKKIKLTMKSDGKFETKVGDEISKGNLKLNPKKTPKEVDVEIVEGGAAAGKTLKAIYELAGDRLKVCYEIGDGERPKEFKADGATTVLLVFKRDK